MSVPELGPCRCGVDHEHSDFEPFWCAEPDCGCQAWRPIRPEGENGPESPAGPPERVGVSVPVDALDFSHERVAQAAAWADRIDGWYHPTDMPADDPHAVFTLADRLEQNWPEGIDPLDVLALTIRRIAAQRGDSSARRFIADIKRRVRQR